MRTESAATAPTRGIEGLSAERVGGRGTVSCVIDRLDLVAGTYTLDLAVLNADGTPSDYHDHRCTFTVTSPVKDVGVFRPPHRWTFSGGISIGSAARSADR